jgi:hypothetical protein
MNWIYALARDARQQQQHVANILALKFMIKLKYRNLFLVCQGEKLNFFCSLQESLKR